MEDVKESASLRAGEKSLSLKAVCKKKGGPKCSPTGRTHFWVLICSVSEQPYLRRTEPHASEPIVTGSIPGLSHWTRLYY